ncbi:MAG: PSD1 domain-containing protein [Candidatus Hydrogenedentes bacterium]|nr:PSD1 domain-containing protein [Candidatus Hydrogenedentota bacterium]
MIARICTATAALALLAATAPPNPASASETYAREIAPIFARACVSCHGPEQQKAGLRLDSPAALAIGGDSGPPLRAGDPAGSLLYQAVAGLHESLAMPPKGDPLTTEDLAAIQRWIEAGAQLPEEEGGRPAVQSDHWSFQPVTRPEIPETTVGWGDSPIDAFILKRLEAAGVAPSPQADPKTLVRRLYLDLVGLPPDPQVADAFAENPAPAAYEKLVDSLLASPHFGERWGRHWLDLARYADSDGYEKDSPRPYAWRYRDWVINAINEDLPYDQFVIHQLAGDLLPGATLAQRAATGFHRNTLTNREGGIDPEEDRVKQAVDRTNTTGAVFMGLTMACAQCHTHKYDPITQREYFGMYAFFDAAMEENIPAPLPGEEEAHAAAVADHEAKVAAKQAELDAYRPSLLGGLAEWEAAIAVPEDGWNIQDPVTFSSIGGAALEELDDRSILASGENGVTDTYTVVLRSGDIGVRGLRLEVLTHNSLTFNGPGRAHNGNFVLSEITVNAAPAGRPHSTENIKIARAKATFEQEGYPIEAAFDGDPVTGWAILDGRNTNQNRSAEFTFESPAGFDRGTIFTITLDQRYGEMYNLGRFRIALTTNDPENILYPDDVVAALQTPAADRSAEQIKTLLDYHGQNDETYVKPAGELRDLQNNPPKPIPSIVMAIARNPNPPVTRVHNRGDFLQPGAVVGPHTPAVLHPLQPRGESPDRLDLARWIVDPANPLTARVAVNRVWEHLFGDGLARTSEDFGTRTEDPTHPELLDWLAASFIEDHHWSRKSLIKAIVMSAAYRQSSHIREDLFDRDPANRLIARQNRFRVEAEITRDLFLAASGLLVDDIGGPSVRPPLPEGVANLGYANSVKWPESEGPDKYRRGLYIFFQRTVAYPMLVAFDCPDSNEAKLSRNRSNTPLQALTLLNDPVFVEAAQALGTRLLELPAGTGPERAREAFRLCMGRDPIDRELDLLVKLIAEQEALFKQYPEEAKTLLGDYLPENMPPEKAAAHMILARSIMNLDEFLTRE